MVTTETRTRTETEPNYFSSRYYNDQEDEVNQISTPTYTPSSYTYEDEDDEPAYEVEREYNSREENEVDSGYRVVNSGLTEIKRKENVLVNENYEKQRISLSPRLKIAFSVACVVFALLVAFVIYNAVAIGNAKAQIAQVSQEVSAESQVINELESEYNYLGTDQTIKNSLGNEYVYATSTNKVYVDAPVLDEVVETKTPTNWFNGLCEFLSSLF